MVDVGAKMIAALQRLQKDLPDKFGAALRQEAEIEATACKQECPVKNGTLRASIHAEGPERTQGNTIRAKIVAGGPAADYALIVHEDLEALHKVGGAKFIERPLSESAPHMATRIGARIALNDGKA